MTGAADATGGGGLVRARVRRPRFHELTVREVRPLTDRAVAVTFDVPTDLATAYAFQAGQYVTLRAEVDGQDVRRPYSLCISPAQSRRSGTLRVAASRVDDGVMSTWLTTRLRAGDTVRVMEPRGELVATTGPDPRVHVGVAAGSGITPLLSVITHVLDDRPHDAVVLVLGAREPGSVMFADELRDLCDRFPDRFAWVEVYSRAGGADELHTGRLGAARIARLLDDDVVPRMNVLVDGMSGGAEGAHSALDVQTQAPGEDSNPHVEVHPRSGPRVEWYLCGPGAVVADARSVLAERGVEPQRIHLEVFHEEAPTA